MSSPLSPMPSSLSVRGECPICFEKKEINLFRVLPCGHCYCASCIGELRPEPNKRKIKCPLCRRKYLKDVEISPLRFEPVIYDLSKSPVEHVVDGINLMDKTCPTVSVKRAHNKLTKVVENIDNDNAAKLLKAIDDFAKRIIPLFEELELGRTRIQELEDDQRGSSNNLTRQVESLQQEVLDLHNSTGVLQQEILHFRNSNGVLQQQFLDALESAELFRAKTEESRQQLAEVKQSLVTREEEHKQAIDSIKRFKISDERKSEKLRGLKREVIELSQKLRQEKEVRDEEQDSGMDVDQDHKHTTTAPSGTKIHVPGLSSSYMAADDGDFGFEGMPRPGFGSRRDAESKKMNRLIKKRPHDGSKTSSSFPLSLDAKGRPKTTVQIGPKSTIRIAQRF